MLQIIKQKKKLLIAIIILALPAIGEMSLNTLLGVADTMMISRMVGEGALSAVGFANQIIFTLIFVFSSFNTGATSMVARSFGEKDYKKLNKIAGQTVTINFIIGVIISILAIVFARNIFSIYDVTEEVQGLTLDYFYTVSIGLIFMFLSFSYAAILRGSGDTMTPLIITGIANVLNIIGNYVLIKGVGPFPEMGIAGAALSTTLSRVLATVLYTYVLFIKKKKVHLKLKNLRMTKNIVKPLWKISYPGAVEQALMQGAFIVIGVIVSQLDTDREASFRILINLESISFMPAVGLSIAAATLVGKALGEKDIKKAVQTGYTASVVGILWGIIMGLVFLLWPDVLVKAFSEQPKIIALSASVMFALGLNQPLLNFMIVMSGALRGAGDTRNVMLITALRLWTVFIPFSYVFVILMGQGLVGVWYAEIASFVVFSAIIFLRFHNQKWVNIKFDVQPET
ncbi:MATE family efflux transporter [Vallitalea pronyensis]|uniref:Probable multidrug resistance protein NorM n=1 Tax=Vallitalea pronyensis TaxID=1348613 RepID=A0A8J8MJB2_9FIRM|nr:MATE family efflux transporter [Vallitalea pronyensis]QUI22877.1 MATE family efflux transporter [Vallitalea pronyensis]